jgi:hypothetical protein
MPLNTFAASTTVTTSTSLSGILKNVAVNTGVSVKNIGTINNLLNRGEVIGGTVQGSIFNTGGTLSGVALTKGSVLSGGRLNGVLSGIGFVQNAVLDVSALSEGIQVGSQTKVTQKTVSNNIGVNLTNAAKSSAGVFTLDKPFLLVEAGTKTVEYSIATLVQLGLNVAFGNTSSRVTLNNPTLLLSNPELGNVVVPVVPYAIYTTNRADGLQVNTQGRIEIVKNGILMVFTPSSADYSAYLAGIFNIGAASSTSTSGITYAQYNEAVFAFQFGMFTESSSTGTLRSSSALELESEDVDTDTDTDTAAATFSMEGDIREPLSYKIVVHYPDGTIQSLVPSVHDPVGFEEALTANNWVYLTNPNTGVITVADVVTGKPVHHWLPSYNVSPVVSAGEEEEESVVSGIESAGDINGDGKEDSYFLTAAGLQVLYGL